MNTRSLHAVVMAIALILLGAAWFTARTIRTSRAELATVERESERLARALHQAEDRLASAKHQRTALHAQIDAPPQPPSPAASKAPTPARSRSQQLNDDPQLQLLSIAARRGSLNIQYGPLIRALGLSEANAEKFREILIERETRQMDASAALSAQGIAGDNPLSASVWTEIESDFQAAGRELLGEANYQKFRDYNQSAPQREIVSGLAGAAALGGEPLTTRQAEQLTELLHRAATGHAAGGMGVDWRIVTAEAGAFLTPAQKVFIETTESRGPRGVGGRFMPQLHATINQAIAAEAALRTTDPR